MDTKTILDVVNGILQAFKVSGSHGQAVITFTEFWLRLFQSIADGVARLGGS